MKRRSQVQRYVVCVTNAGFRTSLVVRRIYEQLPDEEASRRGLLRVIDESGEDYLYPEKMFVAITLPAEASKAFSVAG